MFQIRKCGDPDCCRPPTTPRDYLQWLPDPVLSEDKEHFLTYKVVATIGDTDECYAQLPKQRRQKEKQNPEVAFQIPEVRKDIQKIPQRPLKMIQIKTQRLQNLQMRKRKKQTRVIFPSQQKMQEYPPTSLVGYFFI